MSLHGATDELQRTFAPRDRSDDGDLVVRTNSAGANHGSIANGFTTPPNLAERGSPDASIPGSRDIPLRLFVKSVKLINQDGEASYESLHISPFNTTYIW
jgi:hypothetical protein